MDLTFLATWQLPTRCLLPENATDAQKIPEILRVMRMADRVAGFQVATLGASTGQLAQSSTAVRYTKPRAIEM